MTVQTYDLLSDDEKDSVTVQHMRHAQMEHYTHSVNLARFDEMITNPIFKNTSPEYQAHMKKMRAETAHRILEHDLIIASLTPRMPTDSARLDEVMVKISAGDVDVPATRDARKSRLAMLG